MQARNILAALAVVFFVAAALRWARNARRIDAAARTWLVIAFIFIAVSAWLQWHTS
jgi:hypothetical protein